ncbi:MAG TPA: response regulator [Acidimicrobiales bacterium]|nr:response regulator [Acidimicrobiales bacterium]
MSGAAQDAGPRVLVVEDNVAHARFVRTVLESMDRPVQVHQAGRVSSACERLRQEIFDCVIADLHLPDGRGPAVVLRLLEAAPSVPVLVVSALDDPSMAQLAMSAGAHDYLTKDRLTPELLSHVIVRASQRASTRGATTDGGLLDPATGVFSQRGIELAAGKAVAFARRHGHPVTVLHLEVAGTAEEVADVARVVATVVRDADLVGRIGSSGIVLVLPDDRSDPPAILGRLGARLAGSSVASVDVRTEVRRFDPEEPVPAADLLRVASGGPAASSALHRRALVVTGDDGTVASVRSALGDGWTVLAATGVGPAGRLTALEEPHVAIVDLAIDGGAGLAVVRGIAEQPEAAGLPIIGIRADATPGVTTGAGNGMVATVARERLAAELSYLAERVMRVAT